jgi:hypothetical protein
LFHLNLLQLVPERQQKPVLVLEPPQLVSPREWTVWTPVREPLPIF